MKHTLLATLALLLFPVVYAQNYTAITAAHIVDSSGIALALGNVLFAPTNCANATLGFQPGGGGIATTEQVSCIVVNGAITTRTDGSVCQVANTALTNPAHVGFSVTITDTNQGGVSVQGPGYSCIQPTGATFSLDSVVPNTAPLTVVTVGPTGPAGAAATLSIATPTTLTPGSAATATNTGTSSAAVLQLGLPQGATGATGPTGSTGPTGPSGYTLNAAGNWSSTTTYPAGAVVTNGGQSYISEQAANVGYAPTLYPAYWQLISSGYQLNEYTAALTYTGPMQAVTVVHGLNTLTPIVVPFFQTGSTHCLKPSIVDANTLSLTCFGAATLNLMVATPGAFTNTAAAYNAAAIPTAGLVAQFPMTEGSGTTLVDSSNAAANATAVNLTWAAVTGFASSTGAVFNGTSTSATLAAVDTNLNFDGHHPFTVSIWANFNNLTGVQGFLSAPGLALYVSGGKPGTVIQVPTGSTGAGTGIARGASGSVPSAGLHHLVWTYDGSGTGVGSAMAWYCDGVALGSSNGPDQNTLGSNSAASSTPSSIGFVMGRLVAYSYGPGGYFNGALAGLLVWNRVLTQAEIANVYSHGAP